MSPEAPAGRLAGLVARAAGQQRQPRRHDAVDAGDLDLSQHAVQDVQGRAGAPGARLGHRSGAVPARGPGRVVETVQGSLAQVGVTMRVSDLEGNGVEPQAVLLDELDRPSSVEPRTPEPLAEETSALWLYGEPQICAARRALKGVEWSPRGSIQSLHAAYFDH